MVFNIDPCCLGLDGSNDLVFMRAFVDASILSTGRLTHGLPFIWNIKRFLNIGSEKRLAESIRIVHNFVENIIQQRLEGKSENYEDILSLFIHAGEKNSLEFLRDMVISFILAGRDTTSSALSWFFWLLSSHPIVIRNIRSEIKTVRARNGKTWGDTFDLDELKELNYLHAALSDSLRLYPPVPIDLKECMNDDLLPDRTVIKKGWFIFYHPFAMGRMANIWGEDYEAFRPERWLENGIWRPESPFRYPVFQAGPRICLGKEIAYIQMKFIAASVIQQFDIYPLRKENMPEYIPSLTLRMKNGLPVRVKEGNL
ncbi:hypothetical protein Nepgr_030157 [Nepenthes gracilis]|uniref:Cytochrome P450 n=1 Tax=Nepenthes gracilis TaxID=150966 RepID=A0AAD3TFP4_NEPGR|nr:hypothetical protein Nepgr_030157 [Nepenthes gracilis]